MDSDLAVIIMSRNLTRLKFLVMCVGGGGGVDQRVASPQRKEWITVEPDEMALSS
jgi:hypothetical protein